MIYNPDNYPVDALPPIIRDAVLEASDIVKSPFGLLANSALGAISQACQASVRVKRFNGLTSPVHLFLMTIAESGERKTTADRLFTTAFPEFERKLTLSLQPAFTKFESDLGAWKAEKKGLTSAISKNAKEGLPISELKVRLDELMSKMPVAPTLPKPTYRDATMDAMLVGLQAWPSAAICSNEAGALFSGRTFNQLAVFNALWDGGTFSVDRKNAPPVLVHDASLTVNLMAQPKTYQKFLSGKGELARDSGFNARTLHCYPTSTQGMRFEHSVFPAMTLSLDTFNDRLRQILSSTIDANGRLINDKVTLEFSFQAKHECLAFSNWVEGQIGANGYYSDVKDAASKIAENMARVAALFHFFSGQTGEISVETTLQAIAVSTWYLNQFRLLFSNQWQPPQQQLDCWELEQWLRAHAMRTGFYEVPKSILLRYGPNRLRNKPALDPILFLLNQQQKVIVVQKNKTGWVQMCQPLFAPQF